VSENFKRFGIAVALVVGCIYGYIVLRGPQGLPALQDRWREIRSLQQQNAELQRQVQMKREKIDRLRNSQAEQELMIRQRLKLLKKGETTFITSDDDADGLQLPTPSTSPTPTALLMSQDELGEMEPAPSPVQPPLPTAMAMMPAPKASPTVTPSPTVAPTTAPTPVPTPDPALDPGTDLPPPTRPPLSLGSSR